MRSLKEWQFFLEHELAHETWLASCMYGSVHKKEFLFLFANMETEFLHRKCSRDHAHVQIAGSYAKPSATYTDELAEALASAFDRALKTKLRSAALEPFELKGLESPLCNVLLVSGRWRTEKVWRWKVPTHINIQEVLSTVALLKDRALRSPK